MILIDALRANKAIAIASFFFWVLLISPTTAVSTESPTFAPTESLTALPTSSYYYYYDIAQLLLFVVLLFLNVLHKLLILIQGFIILVNGSNILGTQFRTREFEKSTG